MDCEHEHKGKGSWYSCDQDFYDKDDFEADPVWQGVQARWHDIAKSADDGRKRKIELALQLANHLLEEYNEDKQKFRDEQSPKVNRLLRQFKSTYESNYGAEPFAHEMKEYWNEIRRQSKVFNLPLPEVEVEKLEGNTLYNKARTLRRMNCVAEKKYKKKFKVKKKKAKA